MSSELKLPYFPNYLGKFRKVNRHLFIIELFRQFSAIFSGIKQYGIVYIIK